MFNAKRPVNDRPFLIARWRDDDEGLQWTS